MATSTTLTTALRGVWVDPYVQIRRAWDRCGRLLLTVLVTSRHVGVEEIADDDLRWFAARGLRVSHVSERRTLGHGDRLFWVLAVPVSG